MVLSLVSRPSSSWLFLVERLLRPGVYGNVASHGWSFECLRCSLLDSVDGVPGVHTCVLLLLLLSLCAPSPSITGVFVARAAVFLFSVKVSVASRPRSHIYM